MVIWQLEAKVAQRWSVKMGGGFVCRLNSTKKIVVVAMQAENEVYSAFWVCGHMRNKSPQPRCVPLVWNRADSVTSFFSLACLNVEWVYWLHSKPQYVLKKLTRALLNAVWVLVLEVLWCCRSAHFIVSNCKCVTSTSSKRCRCIFTLKQHS